MNSFSAAPIAPPDDPDAQVVADGWFRRSDWPMCARE
jgi:hypothetical protein